MPIPPRSSAAQYKADELYARKREHGLLALPASTESFNWEGWYTDLYTKLELADYLPKVLSELISAERAQR
jgi:hypothetical protein